MIRQVLGDPYLSLLTCTAVTNAVGLPLVHVSDNYTSGAIMISPETQSAFVPDYVALADSLEVFNAYMPRLTKSRNSFLVFVVDALSVLNDFALPIQTMPLTATRLVELLSVGTCNFSGLRRVADKYQEALRPMREDSFVQRLYPAFYRITDKTSRVAAQQSVYRYLSGLTQRPPSVGVPLIDTAVRSPQGLAIRAACITHRMHGASAVEATGVDEHTVNYVLAQGAKGLQSKRKR